MNQIFISPTELNLSVAMKAFVSSEEVLVQRLLIDMCNFLNKNPPNSKDKENKKLFALYARLDDHLYWRLTPMQKPFVDQLFKLVVERWKVRVSDPSTAPVTRRVGLF